MSEILTVVTQGVQIYVSQGAFGAAPHLVSPFVLRHSPPAPTLVLNTRFSPSQIHLHGSCDRHGNEGRAARLLPQTENNNNGLNLPSELLMRAPCPTKMRLQQWVNPSTLNRAEEIIKSPEVLPHTAQHRGHTVLPTARAWEIYGTQSGHTLWCNISFKAHYQSHYKPSRYLDNSIGLITMNSAQWDSIWRILYTSVGLYWHEGGTMYFTERVPHDKFCRPTGKMPGTPDDQSYMYVMRLHIVVKVIKFVAPSD